MRRVLLWAPPIIYMAVIFGFSAQSNPIPVVTEHVWDKLLHTTEYAGLALLLTRAFVGEGVSLTTAAFLAMIATSVYGGTDEFHQWFVPGRNSDVRDWLADSVGAGVGAIVYTFIASRWTNQR